MGPGGTAPTRLDTPGKCSQTALNSTRNRDDSPGPEAVSAPARRAKQYAPRHRLGRGRRATWRTWVDQVADELRALGHGEIARHLAGCGRITAVQSCRDCAEQWATAELTTSCNVRVCPLCARRLARERVDRLAPALGRIAGYVAAQALATAERRLSDSAESERLAAHHAELAARARARAELAQGTERLRALSAAEIHAARALARLEAARRARWDAARAREAHRGRWSWRLVTVSPPWHPLDGDEYSVDGLAARVVDAWERWERLREAYAVDGLAGAIASIECSDAGHVHVHALVYGPWMQHQRAVAIAGCHVDLRSLDTGRAQGRTTEERVRAALVEAAKYAIKSPSPLSHAWVSGEARRVAHPRLAAAWVIATRAKKLGRVYGVARDAIAAQAAEDAATPRVERPRSEPSCRCCGSYDLSQPRAESTETAARFFGLAWGPTLQLRRRRPADDDPDKRPAPAPRVERHAPSERWAEDRRGVIGC